MNFANITNLKKGRVRLAGRAKSRLNILITAGPTQESIDPVRFISNHSTGRIGYTIAKLAKKRGHHVTLISGPTHLIPPAGVKCVYVVSASQMREATEENFKNSDCLFMAAAVSDFRAKKIQLKKIKPSSETLCLQLRKNPDILFELGKKKEYRLLVGFCLETDNLIESSLAKLKRKRLDFIVGNSLSKRSSPFGENKVCGVVIDKDGKMESFSGISKERLAMILLDRVEGLWYVK